MDRELLIGMAVVGEVAYSTGLKDGADMAVRRSKNDEETKK